MIPRKKYNSLTNVPETFTTEEWQLAVSVIDFLPHDILASLAREYGIEFTGGNENTDEETLVHALLATDLKKEETMEIVNRYVETIK